MRMQRDALIAAGVDPRDVFQETASGASMAKRREFQAMMKDVRAGDIVYVWKLDRLARNAMDLHITATAIERKGARLVVLTMPGMDTGTPVGRAMFGMLAVFAEFERAISNERTIAGLKAARERGRIGGRVSKYTDEQVLALHNLMPAEGAKALGMKSSAGFKKRLAKALENAAKGTPDARVR
jgi:DNA invertase Pin-like site-specific DNA recombinase